MADGQKYEAVIGLEIHAQLATYSKLFCGDAASFGAEPNTHISPITMGHPGTLPKTNAKAIEYAIRIGLACGSKIAKDNYFARKNYFYPDLPKGYQVSQHTTPICEGGSITIQLPTGEKNIQLNRIHLEEDAGKSIHDISATDTLIDFNRAGTPLIEMVTEPCIHSAEEAFLFVSEVRKLVRWIGICDGNMEEGSLRCDANISIRLKGTTSLGTRVEVKNLNSIRNIKKAIEFEIDRLIQITESGGTIIQQTRSFDANNDTTFSIRDKEDANDYRYFPDPDLAPLHLTDTFIESIKNKLPTLPATLKKQWKIEYDLSDYAIDQLVEDKEEADFYIQWASASKNYKAIANWMIGPIRAAINEGSIHFQQLSSLIPYLVELVELVETNQLSFSVASTKVLKEIMTNPGSPKVYANTNNLLQTSSTKEIEKWIEEVLTNNPSKVAEYKKGKKGLLGLFVGEVKKISKGKADPKITTSLLEQKLA
ncbi:MAG: Asp-tRNA(Asn)/Glu-tRNA(Gln) amidotransferase subunit GatB [Chitinophagia bacterium]|jgi:aspartyl-tRNA(Asn)/glutamyl-tRNA(Gln) amidotransferase subunit B|nr:Asp-tRNA(Asn)/Glu-tRNA(Gln) amidotransferase subunit GatB [Chitinophagia bacterium]NCA29210.1 Asp-tRNA(Asn)/Glu-tRNA(Gln) amidotransferase subunit GatB [Chitinophagia bacterium]NDD15508.1 Asp-tRNA(Asn)/Glu-tRNA(Gln) amidotransferase subunit GatB [Chitinophagia bacterium]